MSRLSHLKVTVKVHWTACPCSQGVPVCPSAYRDGKDTIRLDLQSRGTRVNEVADAAAKLASVRRRRRRLPISANGHCPTSPRSGSNSGVHTLTVIFLHSGPKIGNWPSSLRLSRCEEGGLCRACTDHARATHGRGFIEGQRLRSLC